MIIVSKFIFGDCDPIYDGKRDGIFFVGADMRGAMTGVYVRDTLFVGVFSFLEAFGFPVETKKSEDHVIKTPCVWGGQFGQSVMVMGRVFSFF